MKSSESGSNRRRIRARARFIWETQSTSISKRIKSAEVLGEENVEALRHLGTQKVNELATMDERIQIAETFSESDFNRYSGQLGHKKTLLLTTEK